MKNALVALWLGALLVGCAPREPGPHESEFGEVTYWQVIGSALKWGHLCTDEAGGIDQVEAPTFEDNSYLMYRLSEDGTEAVAQTCDTLSASTCSDSETDIVFSVEGNALVWDPEPELTDLEASDCDLQVDEKWTITDDGESGEMVAALVFSLVGNEAQCAQLQADAAAEAPNGQGLEGCTMNIELDLAFGRSDAP
jgi:hypothetical protein